MDEMTAMAAAHASRLGQSLNKITGYHEIEELKRAVVENGGCLIFKSLLLSYLCAHDLTLRKTDA